MAVKKRSSKGGQTVKLDLRTTSRGKAGGYRYPEGEYKVKITKAERKSAQSGNTQIVLSLTIVEPKKYAGKPLIDRLTLTEKAMFRVGWLLDATGIKWKNAVLNFPLSKLEDQVIGIQLYDDEYNNRTSSKVSEYYSEEEIDDLLAGGGDDDEDEDDDEDLDDENEAEDDLDDLDRAELKKRAKAADIAVKKSMSDDDIREALREAEDDDEDEDDEDLDELDDDDL